MNRKRRVGIIIAAGLVVALAAALSIWTFGRTQKVTTITGAVITQSANPHLQRPIARAVVTIRTESAEAKGMSEASGLFRLQLQPPAASGDSVQLQVAHPDYHPFAITATASDRIHVIRLTPKNPAGVASSPGREISISNIRVRYATSNTTTNTVGTAVRTFDVINKGDVPCQDGSPCSPNGKWKASIGSLTLEAGENKQFRNVRVSCIAGPCPFTAVEQDGFSRGGPVIKVSVRNWSDPVTYLVEAEVAITMETELIRHAYPVTFGRSMNFTLPAAASGPSIETDVNGSAIVFPLGPELRLSWADCRFEEGSDRTKQFRCELKPGYRFD